MAVIFTVRGESVLVDVTGDEGKALAEVYEFLGEQELVNRTLAVIGSSISDMNRIRQERVFDAYKKANDEVKAKVRTELGVVEDKKGP